MSSQWKQSPTLEPLTLDWNIARHTARGWPQFLEAVQIDGLRGWTGERVEFRFPVVAVAGENGAGKSTLLKVAAAAYTAQQENGLTFYPDDFFPNTPWERVSGVTLTYQLRRGDISSTKTQRKLTERWRGMPERFSRPVYFLDISRTQPINTLVGYGKIAKELIFPGKVTPFQDDDRKLLSRIMNKAYTASSMAVQGNKQVGLLATEAGNYSNFHQGAGEDATADLVALLRSAPNYSLIIIDEVEASLHPRAQRRLMTELFALSRNKKIQFILSTHSAVVLEQLPTEARIFVQLQRQGPRNIVYGVTPEFALSLMDDLDHPELTLYCEDERAQTLIDALITAESPELVNRLAIIPVGAASVVRTLGDLVNQGKLPLPSLGVLDADQSAANGCIVLPGSLPPEREVLGIAENNVWDAVSQRLGVRTGDLLEALDDARQLSDHHSWVRRIAERLGPRIRVGRVWEDAAAVWAQDVVDPRQRAVFVESIAQRLS